MSCDALGGKLMNSILYGNFRIELLTDVGGKLQRIPLQTATSQLAARQPATAAGGEVLPSLGREEELRRLRLAVQAGDPIELVGPCGFGKTTLLRQLASTASQELARPSVYLRLGKERLDDTLQRLFDASYTSPQPFKPTPRSSAPSCSPRSPRWSYSMTSPWAPLRSASSWPACPAAA
jgi:hypothetical protein